MLGAPPVVDFFAGGAPGIAEGKLFKKFFVDHLPIPVFRFVKVIVVPKEGDKAARGNGGRNGRPGRVQCRLATELVITEHGGIHDGDGKLQNVDGVPWLGVVRVEGEVVIFEGTQMSWLGIGGVVDQPRLLLGAPGVRNGEPQQVVSDAGWPHTKVLLHRVDAVAV